MLLFIALSATAVAQKNYTLTSPAGAIITPGLDLEEVADYAQTKNIHIMLWTLAMTLDRQLETAMAMFETPDVKLIPTDFMDRDDQKTVAFYQRMAEAAGRHKILIMFHGAFKGAGFERTYPNAISREAVLGSEYNIRSEKATPEHDLLIPFIRMVGGPMDYEPRCPPHGTTPSCPTPRWATTWLWRGEKTTTGTWPP